MVAQAGFTNLSKDMQKKLAIIGSATFVLATIVALHVYILRFTPATKSSQRDSTTTQLYTVDIGKSSHM